MRLQAKCPPRIGATAVLAQALDIVLGMRLPVDVPTREGYDGWRVFFGRVFFRSTNPMAVLDHDRRIVEVNPAEISVLGYNRETMVGARVDLFLDPEEWKSLDSEWRAFRQRGSFQGERSMISADNKRVAFQYAADWVSVEGRNLALYVTLEVRFEPLRLAREEPKRPPLSAREREVLGKVAMGERAHEIAGELGITTNTVQSHIRNAMKKYGARSQAQLIAIACTRGLLDASRLA